MQLLQLSPSIPVTTPNGKGQALFVQDLSQEHDLLWYVADDATGEVWCWKNSLVRLQVNKTMDRPATSPIYSPQPTPR